jgi:hypothetical protein
MFAFESQEFITRDARNARGRKSDDIMIDGSNRVLVQITKVTRQQEISDLAISKSDVLATCSPAVDHHMRKG